MLVAQTVAAQGQVAGSGGVHEAGSQTAQTAVAQSVVLDVLQDGQVHALGGEQGLHLVQDAQVEQVAVHQTADQELGGDVVGLAALGTGGLACAPVLVDGHHDSLAQSVVQLVGIGLGQRHIVLVLELGFGPVQDVFAVVAH